MKILIVEDEEGLREALIRSLTGEGYLADGAADGDEGYQLICTGLYDLVLLDIMLPVYDGLEVLRRIRKQGIDVPVILLTARSTVEDKVGGMDLGADDYLTKPFSVEELLARLRATQRRLAVMKAGAASAGDPVFVNGPLRIDYAAGLVQLGGEDLHLTPIEYKLLCLMAANVGKVLTHGFITQKVWGSSWDNDVASLRVFMATLRKKLESAPDSPQFIQTHIGIGYRMLKVE